VAGEAQLTVTRGDAGDEAQYTYQQKDRPDSECGELDYVRRAKIRPPLDSCVVMSILNRREMPSTGSMLDRLEHVVPIAVSRY
jgi:hypothetical protein